MAPQNSAAWLMAAKAKPLEVKSAPYTGAQADEIVVKNGAVAINPIDWKKQDLGNFLFSFVKYPFVLGSDVAGEIVEVGSNVTRFKVGDRVAGHAVGIDEKVNKSSQGAFQLYTVLQSKVTTPIPSTVSFESASVIPLGLSTAAGGLFEKDQLALQLPTNPPASATGKTLLVWGGSTSVGVNAIQLAVAAGYEVITTASPRNFDLVKKLGASQVFDYNSKTVIPDLIDAFKDKTTAGAITMGHGAAEACLDILDKCKGDKFISMATFPLPEPAPTSFVVPTTIAYFVSSRISQWCKSKTRHIRMNFIYGISVLYNDVGKAIYEDYLPGALEAGTFIPAPDPLVVGKGLEHVQAALDLQMKGVSAKKVVVSL